MPQPTLIRANGRTLTRLRKERGLVQTAVARAAGITSRQLRNLEHGKTRTRPEVAHRLAAALGVPVEQVVMPGDRGALAAAAVDGLAS